MLYQGESVIRKPAILYCSGKERQAVPPQSRLPSHVYVTAEVLPAAVCQEELAANSSTFIIKHGHPSQ